MIAMIKRAFGWNLGKVVPTPEEATALSAAGITDPSVQKYAVWRKSALAFAALWTGAAFVLAVMDMIQDGFNELTKFGVIMEFAWLVSALGLAGACIIGALQWKRPGAGFKLLVAAWMGGFLLPFFSSLLPVALLYNIHSEPPVPGDVAAKAWAMGEFAVGFVMSAGGYLLLLPAVISLIPGTVNGCLRIKSLLPAAQLPGWLLICAAPLFLLFWIIVLVIINHLAQSLALVAGVLLWAGAPIWYTLRGKVFVQSQIGESEAAKIGGVKKLVGITTMLGLALMATFALSMKVAGLSVVGFDREHTVATKIDELSEQDDEVSLKDVEEAFHDSNALVYALDMSNWRMIVDILAKTLVVTVVFADVVLRATVWAWKNDRTFRSSGGAAAYDETMSQADDVLK